MARGRHETWVTAAVVNVATHGRGNSLRCAWCISLSLPPVCLVAQIMFFPRPCGPPVGLSLYCSIQTGVKPASQPWLRESGTQHAGPVLHHHEDRLWAGFGSVSAQAQGLTRVTEACGRVEEGAGCSRGQVRVARQCWSTLCVRLLNVLAPCPSNPIRAEHGASTTNPASAGTGTMACLGGLGDGGGREAVGARGGALQQEQEACVC